MLPPMPRTARAALASPPAPRSSAPPAVTVLMAVHNGAAHLEETLRSILSQTFTGFEFLIIDDGSDDATPALLRHAADSDPRIVLLTNPKSLGLGASLCKGLAHAKGQFVARMDADDIAHPERLALQLAYMRVHPETCLLSCWAERFDHGRGLMAPRPGAPALKATLAFGNPICHPGAMLRRPLLQAHHLTYRDLPTAEDYTLWCELAPHGHLDILPQVLLRYRVHGTSMSARKADLCNRMVRDIQARYIFAMTGLAAPEIHHRFVLNRRMGPLALLALLAWLFRLAWHWPDSAMFRIAPRKLLAYLCNAWLGRKSFHHPSAPQQPA